MIDSPVPRHRRDKRRKKAAFDRTAAAASGPLEATKGTLRERRRQRLSDVERYALAPSITRITRAPRVEPAEGAERVAAASTLRPDLAPRFARLVRRARRGNAYAARTALDDARLVLQDPSIGVGRLDAAGGPSWRAEAHRTVELLQRAYEVRGRSMTAADPKIPVRIKSPATNPTTDSDGIDPSVLAAISSALACARRANGAVESTPRDVVRRMLARAYTERGNRTDAARGAAMNLAADLLGLSRTTLYARLKGYDEALAAAATVFTR